MQGHKEGDIYKIIEVGGRVFEIRYGYYSEPEREMWGPTPIFPSFDKIPIYTIDGYPIITADQDVCKYCKQKMRSSGEGWCADCTYFEKCEEIIGICRCDEKRIEYNRK